jgi:hypothetical protein
MDAFDIFSKRRLKPSQLRAVAERRFGDAQCLLDSANQERANGAIYMAGFVLECLLKAMLLERHPNLGKPVDPAKLSSSDREVLNLLYSHDLEEMIVYLPELKRKLEGITTKTGRSVWHEFAAICEEWTVYARYATISAKLEHAAGYLETVKEVKKWLKGLL